MEVPVTYGQIAKHNLTPTSLIFNKEVSRWNHIKSIMDEAEKGLSFKEKAELKTIFERWILTLANDVEDNEDIIFSKRKISLEYPATAKMLSELEDKKIPSPQNRYKPILNYGNKFIALSSYPKSKLPVIVNNNTVKINDYTRTFPPGNLKILLAMNSNLEVLGAMIMRYACTLMGGRQWTSPLDIYRYVVDRYKVTVEAFASPMNAQILFLNHSETNLKYCSIFPETDAPYGSMGDFFKVDLVGKHVFANPPRIDNIILPVVQRMIQTCERASDSFVKFIVEVPEWTDAEYYTLLMNSSFRVFDHSFGKGQHYFVDTTDKFKKNIAYFNTHLFVLSVNVEDTYTDLINFMETLYKS
jgi:hypothetical protein